MRKLIVILTAFFVSACSATNVRVAENQTIPEVQKGQAQIVFMRSTQVNALVNTVIYEVTSGKPKLIGNIPNGSKVITNLVPGDHVFMVGNGSYRDFMRASLMPNKRYFVVVAARWPATFTMRPVRHSNSEFLYSSDQFSDLLDDTDIVFDVMESEDSDVYEAAVRFYKEKWPQWQGKSAAQKEVLTLHSQDSIN